MKIFKRISCILLAALVLCMPLVRTYQAHAAAVAASTLAAYAVLGTALTACGILIATQDVPVSDALAAAWDQTTDNIKNDIRNIKLAVGVTGGLVAHWTADKWGRFTRWVKDTFHLGAENAIPIAAAATLFVDACLTQSALNLKAAPRLAVIGRDLSTYEYLLNSRRDSFLKFAYNASGYSYAYLTAGESVLFTSSASSNIYNTMNNGFRNISIFQPIICGNFYVQIATKYQTVVSSLSESSLNNATFSSWKFGAGCGNPSLVGQTIVNDGGILKIGSTGTVIAGNWGSIASYIEACIDAGVVIGIPLTDGTVSEAPDVVGPFSDELPVSIDADYYPDVGSSAPASDLPDGIGYDIPIPLTEPWEGQDVYVKDVDEAPPIDFPRIGEQNPADSMPRVRTDNPALPRDNYLTTAKSVAIPDEIADATVAPSPGPGEGGEGEEQEDDDPNDLKLPAILLTKFPFCIPHDFKAAFESLLADPQPPKFDFHLKIDSLNLDYVFPIDFSSFESVAYFVRWLLSAFWVIILIRGTMRLINE